MCVCVCVLEGGGGRARKQKPWQLQTPSVLRKQIDPMSLLVTGSANKTTTDSLQAGIVDF